MLAAIEPKIRRLAGAMANRYRGLIDRDEANALVALGAVEAWRHKRLTDPEELAPYAAAYGRGRVLAHVRKELRHRDVGRLADVSVHAPAIANPEMKTEAKRLLERLSPQERQVVIRHVCGRDSLAQVSREADRHRAWGSRTLAQAYRQLRDSPSPPRSRPQ